MLNGANSTMLSVITAREEGTVHSILSRQYGQDDYNGWVIYCECRRRDYYTALRADVQQKTRRRPAGGCPSSEIVEGTIIGDCGRRQE